MNVLAFRVFLQTHTQLYIFKTPALQTYVGAAAHDTEYKLLCKAIAKCLHEHINKTNKFIFIIHIFCSFFSFLFMP